MHYLKGLISQEDVTIQNISSPNNRAKYMSEKLIEWEGKINKSIIFGDFNTPLLVINRSVQQKTDKGYI